ncbi:YicC/YloC family endoribonuclease [Peredibacter starrii]|uniref:YicC/YloC family endoribonuclease n=1 Tax=Peredibacter starrii TaxID=28202 RepID=A0AAX4HNK5_9BACT|nr:YicC/YloC family endoribonuclease [Peredibacter starrii]WPU64775.1 YicC/YloC family endoribonuclease [Peredibacter starrii]
MSVYSMTGFGKGEAQGQNYSITTEIKTVNNRFKDFKFRMSSLFNSVELDLRSKLESEFRRGSFDISVTYKRTERAVTEFQVDSKKVEAYLSLMKPVFEKNNVPLQVSPTEFLRSDFYKDEDESKETELEPLVMASFEDAIKALKISRAGEGKKLVDKLLEHLAIYEACLAKIEAMKQEFPDMMKEKLTAKLNEKLKDIKIDESRFLQEVVYYLEKLEIDEEINRARIHVVKLKSVLKSSGEIGRQIDFLLQELGRETNTMGSKSAVPEISTNVVEMKVQLEKIREQALNLE